MKTAVLAAVAAIVGVGSSALATISFNVTITADNQYGLYTGDLTSATTYVGGAFNTTAGQIFVPESYSLTLPTNGFIYITAWSDLSVLQGLMARFDGPGGTFYAGDQAIPGIGGWQVTATGINRANGAAPVTLSDLTAQILLANATTNPSLGWQTPFAGPFNNNASPWGATVGGGMGPNARWTWWDSNSSGFPFNGFDHDEYLIFRLPVNIPTPGAAGLLAVAGLVAARRRR